MGKNRAMLSKQIVLQRTIKTKRQYQKAYILLLVDHRAVQRAWVLGIKLQYDFWNNENQTKSMPQNNRCMLKTRVSNDQNGELKIRTQLVC